MKNADHKIFTFFLFIFSCSLVIILALLIWNAKSFIPPFLVLAFCSMALFFMGHTKLKSFAFTAWVLASVAIALSYPYVFGTWFGFDLKNLIVPLIQIIMFGMGTTLNLADFTRVLRMPLPVFIGIVLQYSVMPFVGYSIAMLFHFEPEIAAGIILVGSCPGGVASNVMTYLANGDVALSVTMTACSTLLSPVMTPFFMKLLASKLVAVQFLTMMLSIINMIIVPVIAGFIANKILYSKNQRLNQSGSLISIACVCAAAFLLMIFYGKYLPGFLAAMKNGFLIGCVLICVVALAKWIVTVRLQKTDHWMDRALPLVSMLGICLIIGIITARSSADLVKVGFVLITATMLHNLIGYFLGYWSAKAVRLDEKTCRTVSFEVGLQNGGMATGLAITVLNSVKTSLAPAIFGPWQNVSGSVLANWWQKKTKN